MTEQLSSRCRALLCGVFGFCSYSFAAETAPSAEQFQSTVKPFFETHCIECHGPKKSKGKVTLHTLEGDLSVGEHAELWQDILGMVESGEMPPDDEPKQPTDAERAAVVQWIEAGLRQQADKSKEIPMPTVARRLTNFEYENTMRDLLGIDLNLIDGLPADPVKPYHFNNSAEMMRMGPEQMDRYLEAARRAMASVIVDPVKPEIHRQKQEWKTAGIERGLANDEVSAFGNSRGTAAQGIVLSKFPKTGEFRIRIQASGIMPPGTKEVPLSLWMGYTSDNSALAPRNLVGNVRLLNTPDNPQVYEFTGRIENYPPRPSRGSKGGLLPEQMAIIPQVLYDDGRLNHGKLHFNYPRAVINWMEFEAPLTAVWPPEHHTRILFDSPLRQSDPKAYLAAVLKRFISRAYRRPATDDEVARFVKINEIIAPDMPSFEAAMRETLAMVLISPDFLFHTIAEDEATRPYELASRLSYFLNASMPDEELLRLAAEKKLDDTEVIAQQARRLLGDKRSADFVRNFTLQWLSIEKMKNVPINSSLFPNFLYYIGSVEQATTEVYNRPTIRDYMIDETVGFVGELIRRNASVFQIVNSDFAYLNQPLAAHYGVAGVEGNELRPVPIKPEHRLGGLLTHGSVLIGNGTGSAPHPIYRAVWLREAILGDVVNPPPADVPALTDTAGESAEHALSIKDLLALHRTKESCNDCHFRLDPWGIPFEHYNAIGKYQPVVPKNGTRVQRFNAKQHADQEAYVAYLNSINTVKVEADARLPNGPEVNGMDDLKKYLLAERKEDIARNMVQRLLTYGLGRELTFRDRGDVDQLLKYMKMNGLGLQDMIITICQSPLMRNTNGTPIKQ